MDIDMANTSDILQTGVGALIPAFLVYLTPTYAFPNPITAITVLMMTVLGVLWFFSSVTGSLENAFVHTVLTLISALLIASVVHLAFTYTPAELWQVIASGRAIPSPSDFLTSRAAVATLFSIPSAALVDSLHEKYPD